MVSRILSKNCFQEIVDNVINVTVNVDGVPLFKSTCAQFWPILCSVNNWKVFLAGFFFGKSKPTSIEDFLQDFLEDYKFLQLNGLVYEGKTYIVKIRCFICDAPARSLLKGIIGHTG